jgi:hypothetical protein
VEAGQAALPRAEQVAFAAQLQVFLGDAEAVLGLAQDGEPGLSGLAERRLVEQQAGRVAAPAPDAPAQLMQLREPEAFGMLDHHDGGFRHINADLDYRGGDQKLRLARREARHGGIFFCALHAAMHQIDFFAEAFAQFLEARLRGGEIDLFGFLDQRADPIGALARVQRAAGRVLDLLDARQRNGAGVDRLAAGRLLTQFGDVHVAEKSEHQRARDRRGGEHQHVDRLALLCQRQPLMHAEAMLLVDDGEREIVERNFLLEQRVGADQEIDVAKRQPVENSLAFAAALAAGEDGDAQAGGLGQRRDGLEMLAGEDFGRRHERRLASCFDHRRRRD